MIETIVSRTGGKSCFIGEGRPLVIIGERINPTGKKKLTGEILRGDSFLIKKYAVSQAKAGAHILDVNVGVAGMEEEKILPQAVRAVMEAADLPLSIDSSNPEAIREALKIYEGKALINSVTGEEKSLETILPLVKKYNAAVIGLAFDESGPANDPYKRLEVARKILKKAQDLKIARKDVLIDCLARPVSLENDAAKITLQTIGLIRQELKVNTVLGISNVSFGLPLRGLLNATFLAMAVALGLSCAILDPTAEEIKRTWLAANLLSGNDPFAAKWIENYRTDKSLQKK